MQIAQESPAPSPSSGAVVADEGGAIRPGYGDYKVIRRNGAVVGFEPARSRSR